MLGGMSRIVIAGCGYVGGALASRLAAQGHDVFALRRNTGELPAGVRPVAADLTRLESLSALPEKIDRVVFAASAGGGGEDAYRAIYLDGLSNLLRALGEQGERPSRVLYTSSTSVFGQQRGEWLDESSVTKPRTATGEILVLAERLLAGSSFSTSVLRLGGIYGPGRTRLLDQVRDGTIACRAEPHFTNRIHRDDAAGALEHLLFADEILPLYLGVDNEPADEREVLCFIAERLGVGPPRLVGEGEGEVRRRAGSKRCRNDRLRSTGYRFRYPTFREGYSAQIAESRGG